MIEKLVRCTRCNEIIRQFDSFGDFGGTPELSGVEWASDDLDEQKQFYLRHEEHPLEELVIDPDTIISDRPAFEPVKVSYMEASNGRETFVVKRTRAALDRPASYAILSEKKRVVSIGPEKTVSHSKTRNLPISSLTSA